MKTAVIMEREIMGMIVRQNHKTEMFNANDLHKVAAKQREIEGLPPKQLSSFFLVESTVELIKEICLTESLTLEEVKTSTRGKFGGTWLHPYLFVKLAAWYSPKLDYQILKWVVDGLMAVRDEGGELNKRMNSTLAKSFPDEFKNPLSYSRVSQAIYKACKLTHEGSDRWQKATKEQCELRVKIQNNIELLADMCPNSGECVTVAIRKAVGVK